MLDLLRPFAYLTVRHPSRLPLWINGVLPVMFTAVVLLGVSMLGERLNVFGTLGLLDRLLGFVQTLTGFYIAALAAVSSFNSPHLDRTMPAPAPTMRIKYNGALQLVPATRRRFLTSMFAYLTALSFVFSMAAIATLTVATPLGHLLEPGTVVLLHWLALAGFLLAVFQLACVTFWGLFYLGERMLTPD